MSRAGEHFALESLADDVLAIAAALRLDDYAIAGRSMGGKVAQLVTARRPAGLNV